MRTAPGRGSSAATPTLNPPTAAVASNPNDRFGWPTDDESRFVAREQMTYIWQRQFGFHADYTGPESLATTPQSTYTLSFTGYLGAKPAPLFLRQSCVEVQQVGHRSLAPNSSCGIAKG